MNFSTFLLLLTLNVSTGFTTQTSSQIRVLPSRSTCILNAQPETKDGKTKSFFMEEVDQSSGDYNKSSNVEGSTSTSTSTSSRGQSQEILDEASDALMSVGWSAPMVEDELTSDDPFVKRINAQIQKESGVDLDELLNPAKVSRVNRQRRLY